MGSESIVAWGLSFLGLTAGPPGGQAVAQESLPETRRDLFGAVLEGLEDLDHDGLGELLVTAPLSHGGRGSVWILSGATGSPLVRIVGEADERWLGVEACGLGDLDGDGRQDLAAGWVGRGESLGGVVVVSGGEGRRLLAVEGEELGWYLGTGLARIGDLDGDGCPDLVVLARDRNWWTTGRSLARAVVLSGADGRELARVQDVTGSERSSIGLFSVGDVDGDGESDVALSGDQADRTGTRREPAFVQIHSGRDLRLLHRFVGSRQQSDFGNRVAGAGDVDADGKGDVVVGFPGYTYREGDPTPMSATVFSGASGRVLLRFRGDGHDGGYACALAGAGDIDGDGHDDLLIGSVALLQGVWLHSGRTGEILRYWPGAGDEPDWHFGDAVASIGDLDGDCACDVAVGRGNWNNPAQPGRVRLYSSRSGELLRELDLAGAEAAWRAREAQRASDGGR